MSVKTEKQHKKSAHRGEKGVISVLHVMIGILLVAVIALTALLFYMKSGAALPRVGAVKAAIQQPSAEATPLPEPASYTISFLNPFGEDILVSALEGEVVAVPEPPAVDGYTFLCWTDDTDKPLEETELRPDGDASFKASYAPIFFSVANGPHPAYLSVDEEGFFRPDEELDRSEAADILLSFLGEDALDFPGAAVLKDMSRTGGGSSLSYRELFTWLSAFFPRTEAQYDFEQILPSDPAYGSLCLAMERGWIDDLSLSPDSALTRRCAARIFNRLSGRTPAAEGDFALVGTILDLSFDDPDFWEIAEAVIPHEAESGEDGERWSSSEALALREEGPYFTGTLLRCIDERGGAVINASYGSLTFGPDGVITTGMPELDELVQAKLVELEIDPATMEQEHMLRMIYDDVTYHNSYLGARKDQLHEVGDISWVNDAAYHMLTVKKGCCYNFAAEFYVLARAIGYDAVIYSGTINPVPIQRPHGWVEIEFDGIPYIFDTELEYTQVITGHTGTVYYKISYERVKGWNYYRGE